MRRHSHDHSPTKLDHTPPATSSAEPNSHNSHVLPYVVGIGGLAIGLLLDVFATQLRAPWQETVATLGAAFVATALVTIILELVWVGPRQRDDREELGEVLNGLREVALALE